VQIETQAEKMSLLRNPAAFNPAYPASSVGPSVVRYNLSKTGFSVSWVSAVDSEGRPIWITDAHRDDGKRCIVRADEKLTAFLELEVAIRGCGFLVDKLA